MTCITSRDGSPTTAKAFLKLEGSSSGSITVTGSPAAEGRILLGREVAQDAVIVR